MLLRFLVSGLFYTKKKMIEDPKELFCMWVRVQSIRIYWIRERHRELQKLVINLKIPRINS